MKWYAALSLSLATALASIAPARGATILYDSSPPDNVSAYNAGPYSPQYVADLFTLSSPATVTGVNFWGGFYRGNSGMSDTFTVNILTDVGGQPGVVLGTVSAVLTGTPNGGSVFGGQDLEFTATFAGSGVSLASGSYFVEPYDTNINTEFAWDTHSQSGVEQFSTSLSGPWNNFPSSMTFQILGSDSRSSVPELNPASCVGAVTVLSLGLTMLRRRRGVA